MHPIIKNNLEIIRLLCRSYHVSELYAFGSVVRDDFRKESDVDLLAKYSLYPNIENIEELAYYYTNQDELKMLLQKILKREVDLIDEKNIKNIYLAENINKEKQLLYAKTG